MFTDLKRYLRGIGCTFRVDQDPQCLFLGRSRCRRPCPFFFHHDTRAAEKAPLATFVVARARASTDHALALLAVVVSFASLAVSIVRMLLGQK